MKQGVMSGVAPHMKFDDLPRHVNSFY